MGHSGRRDALFAIGTVKQEEVGQKKCAGIEDSIACFFAESSSVVGRVSPRRCWGLNAMG